MSTSVPFDIFLHESGTSQLLATNAALNDDGTAEFDTLELRANGVTKATLHLDKKLRIPEKLLTNGSPRKLITLPQAVDEELAALRERLRIDLSRPLTLDAHFAYFGVKSALGIGLNAELRLSLPWLDGDQVKSLLQARARAAINLSIGGAAGSTVTVELAVDVDPAFAAVGRLGWGAPSLPTFDIPWPAFDFSGFQWAGLSGLLPDKLPAFCLPRLPFMDHLTFAWQAGLQPNLTITVTGDNLTFATTPAGNGTLSINKTPVATVANFQVTSNTGVTVTGTVKFETQDITIPSVEFKDDRLPFFIALTGITVSVAGTAEISAPGTSVTTTVKVDKIRIESKQDASLFLVLQAEVTLTIGTTIETKLTKLTVVQPYPVELVTQAVNAAGKCLARIHLDLNVPQTPGDGLMAVLKRIADMLKAAAVWLAQQAGKAAQALASVAEAAFELLKTILDTLLDVTKLAGSHVIIEVRLDANTYRLRQILVTPKAFPSIKPDPFEALGFSLFPELDLKPCFVIDMGPDPWLGIALTNKPGIKPSVTLATDLWLSRATSAAQPVKSVDDTTGHGKHLLEINAELNQNCALVLVAFRGGRIDCFQKTDYDNTVQLDTVYVGTTGSLERLTPNDADVKVQADALKDKIINLLGKAKDSGGDDQSFFKSLESYIKIEADNPTVKNLTATVPLKFHINFQEKFQADTTVNLEVSLTDLSARLTGADRIAITSHDGVHQDLFGLKLDVVSKEKKPDFEAFYLDLRGGKEEFGLSDQARATLSMGGVSSTGKGLQFAVEDFHVGRNGLDLTAETIDDPVMLGGVNMPFRFRSGKINIVNSKLTGANLSGSGQLPPALIGEANVSINLRLLERDGQVVVDSAAATLDKGEDPIVCESTRFRFTLSKVEMSFEREGTSNSGSYHFYFLLTGKARFQPRGGEFTDGLLKNFKDLEIVLDRAPLAGDGRLLMQRISFQAKVDPPRKSRFFDLFEFELRGVGFHPSSPAFNGDPALSISGQVKFTSFGDKFQPEIRFHELWIARPERGSALPRVRLDGLTVGLDLGGMAEVEGTAIAVDGSLPTLVHSSLPANVTANGFLASGRLSIKGWASMSAAMGFLELRKPGYESQLAFFFYIQENKLSVPIPTPVGEIYLREVGFGFGWRYTLAGIAEAERVSTPKELIKVLDEVSKYQGSLDDIGAWEPTIDSATLTLAMRAMFSVSSASEITVYNEAKEKDLSNPLLFDIIAAIRSDLTFLMAVRVWLCVNYADWLDKDFVGRTRPSMRGYMYLSVPKKTFLGRFIAETGGVIGKHPEFPAPVQKALEIVKASYSATLFITPGLFHFELGWPYDLSLEIGDRNGNFYLGCQGGMVFRIEDGASLYGYALRATGFAQIGFDTGGSFGAAVYASASFAIEGKLLSYLSLRAPGESMFYGSFRIDVHVSFSVRVWLEFSIFGGTIRWEIGFSFGITIALALEVAILLNRGIGFRAYASVGFQAFGRSISLGVELRIGGGVLDEARARVDRFLALGLGASTPQPETLGRAPVVEAPRKDRAAEGDKRIEERAQTVPQPPPPPATQIKHPTSKPGNANSILAADFWAMLFPTKGPDADEWYLLQLIPKDLTGIAEHKGSFYAPVPDDIKKAAHKLQIELRPNDPIDIEGFIAVTVDTKGTWKFEKSISKDRMMVDREKDEKVSPPLADIWQESFIVWTDDRGLQLADPPPIHWQRERVPLDANLLEAAKQLEMGSRRLASLEEEKRREHQIEERRSAMITMIADSALRFSQTWASPKPDEPLHCLDLGLTFLVKRSTLDKLLFNPPDPPDPTKPPVSVLQIQRVGQDIDGWGSIQLFNPPERMFRVQQPRLDKLSAVPTKDGIALNWDLEPTWGPANSLWNDPEFHVRHYHIERRITGEHLQEDFFFSFQAKAASVRVHSTEKDKDSAQFHEPPLQFLDDLTHPPSLPQLLRERITKDDADPAVAGRDFSTALKIEYHIFAIDEAGTSDFGTPYPLELPALNPRVDAPLAAELRFVAIEPNPDAIFQRDFNELKITLAATFRVPPSRLILSVVQGTPVPSGQYGADALSTALENPTTNVIELGRQFAVTLVAEDQHAIKAVVTTRPAEGETVPDRDFSLAFDNNNERAFLDLLKSSATLRFFLRVDARVGGVGAISAWTSCQAHMQIGQLMPDKTINIKVDSVFEDYERPLALRFDPIQRANFTTVEAGRMYFLEPVESATLKSIVAPEDLLRPVFEPQPDRKRRAGIRLRWNARPDGVKVTNTNLVDPWRYIGGFHLFDISQSESSDPVTVALLPQSLQGQEPSEMGDFSLIESFYPADATRRAWNDAGFTGWYSLAESSPLFPSLAGLYRRTFMASVDEGVLSALFEIGLPSGINIRYIAEIDGKEHELGLRKLEGFNGTTEGSGDTERTWWAPDAGDFQPKTLRTFFRKAVLSQQGPADGARVLITARVTTAVAGHFNAIVREYVFEDSPHLHPLLADALDYLRYDAEGQYRQYEIVFDPPPSLTNKDFQAWVGNTPEKSDPYGWGVLRTLGLAAGFRVWDSENSDFVAGVDLLRLVNSAFQIAIKLYTEISPVDIGVPFVDLFTAPLETARVYSFDGGPDPRSSDTKDVAQDQLSVVQIALRPVIAALAEKPPVAPRIRYFVLQWKDTAKPGPFQFTLTHQNYDVDLITLGDEVAAAKQVSLSLKPARHLPPDASVALGNGIPIEGSNVVVAVRVIRRDNVADADLASILTIPEELTSKPVDLTQSLTKDFLLGHLLGLFPALSNEQWLDQISPDIDTADTDTADTAIRRIQLLAEERAGLTWPASVDAKLAGLLANWWKRFLDHGIGTKDASHDIRVSLGTIGKPGKWRMAEALDGTVGVVIPEESPYGALKKYAVRPFGRYDVLVNQFLERPPLGDVPEGATVYLTLPRTAPVAKPVILSAARVQEQSTDALELIIARTPDEIISSANRTTSAGLAADGISVGFWRQFANPDWAHAIFGSNEDLLPELGQLDGKNDPLPLTLNDNALAGVRRRVPDAWLGSWIYRMSSLPYFYRIHAMAYANAGVVVSPPAAASFGEGVSTLALSPNPPSYEIENDGTITFHVPLTAFYDCMIQPAQWYPSGPDAIAYLPDPGIAYRISIVSSTDGALNEVLSRETQLEISAASLQPASGVGDRKLYLVQSLGQRIKLSSATPMRVDIIPDGKRWKLIIKATLVPAVILKRSIEKSVYDVATASQSFTAFKLPNVKGRASTFDKRAFAAFLAALTGGGTFDKETASALQMVAANLDDSTTFPSQIPVAIGPTEKLLKTFFDLEEGSYFAAVAGCPSTVDVASITNATFKATIVSLAEETWFGVRRKPRLSVLRGTQIPIDSEIKGKL